MKTNYVYKGWVEDSTHITTKGVAVDGEVEASSASEGLKMAMARYHSPNKKDKWRIFREVILKDTKLENK